MVWGSEIGGESPVRLKYLMGYISYEMSQDLERHFKGDMDAIPSATIDGMEAPARARSLIAHAFLRVWTRLAIDTGQKLEMLPSQYRIGTYKGKMNWLLNEGGLDDVDRLEISGSHGSDYSLVGEVYELEGVARARILFSFQEDEIGGKPVFVSYLVYDESAKDFDNAALAAAMAPSMSKWADTIAKKNVDPLWTYSKENYECVGV
ncbi:MAG: hypothetical protein JSV94_04480 [Methanobacteriota archaeon]|nr:MAG: hypothetical protein JSV94_04480 [Euryarchaeota archaeon]